MKRSRNGFTLVELIVVVIILGVLASMGIPYYYKTIETSRATDSVALGHLLGNAYRMFQVDNPGVSLSGQITNSPCNDGGACSLADASGCRLLRCGYVAQQDWNNSSYNFYVGPGSCGAGQVACVRRNGGSAPYSGWGYNFDLSGVCTAIGTGVPSCPKF